MKMTLMIFFINLLQCFFELTEHHFIAKKQNEFLRVKKSLLKTWWSSFNFFSIRVFFHGHCQLTHWTAGEGRGISFYYTTTSTLSWTFRHLFCNFAREMNIKYVYLIYCICQATPGWDLPPYRITIWLNDDAMLILVCLFVDLIQRFCCSYLTMETGGLELASTIILVLQPNRLTKCASHPKSPEVC